MGKFARDYVPAAGISRGHPDRCLVGRLYDDEFDDEDREWFDAIMPDATQSASHILRWLHKNGVQLNHSTLTRHRRKECCCVRSQ